jgi:glutamate carboxypeptidase
MKVFYLFLLVIITHNASAQLSPDEKKIIDYLKAHHGEAEELLIESVNINSGTLNVDGVRKVGAVYRRELDKLGFTTEWVDLPDSLRRAGHLVASRKGSQGKRLFLIGHLDTVFELDMEFSPYQKLNDSTATGQGVNDMKGGNVVMISALKALHELGLLNNTQIIAYFTGDEESSGSPHRGSKKRFHRACKNNRNCFGL